MRILKTAITIAAALAAIATATAQTTETDNAIWSNARRGDPAAMNQVGIWYYSGNKVPRDYTKAYDWWSRAAQAGNAKSIANLGVCYQYGRGVSADSVAAIRLYVDAIQRGQQQLYKQREANTPDNVFDDMLIALCNERGIGAAVNPSRAAELYSQAAQRGSQDAVMAAARAYNAAGKKATALEYYERAAAMGDTEAMYEAAKIRMARRGQPAEVAHGVEMLKQAAQQGNASAQAHLGMSYLSGNGVDADTNLASQWLRRAAQGGDASAMWQYAELMRREREYDEAMHWMAQAVAAGYQGEFDTMVSRAGNDPYVQYLRGMRYYLVDGDMDAAYNTFKQLAKNKIADAMVMEAVVQADPQYAKSNASKAAKALDKLSDDNMMAAYYLAGQYIHGSGVNRSASKAISLYRQSASAGYGRAQNALADIYYAGQLMTPDRSGAIALYEEAGRQRCLTADGAQRLQQAYTDGVYGLEPDAAKAAAMAHYSSADPVTDMLRTVR